LAQAIASAPAGEGRASPELVRRMPHSSQLSCKDLATAVLNSGIFHQTLAWALLAGIISFVLKAVTPEGDDFFLSNIVNPDLKIFGFFCTFASIITGVRTSYALGRFNESAGVLYALSAAWLQTTSNCMMIGRSSAGNEHELVQFRETLVRLFSMLNAVCFEGLEHKKTDLSSEGVLEVLDFEDLHPDVWSEAVGSENRVEYVFQLVQTLIVDTIESKAFSVPSCVVGPSFKAMADGWQKYYQAKKVADVSTPSTYVMITQMFLVLEIIFIPIVFAGKTSGGPFIAFVYAFLFTFIFFSVHGTAGVLENPFGKETSALKILSIQKDLNSQLQQLAKMAGSPKPTLSAARLRHATCYSGQAMCAAQAGSLSAAEQGEHKLGAKTESAEPRKAAQQEAGDIESQGPTLLTQQSAGSCLPSGAPVSGAGGKSGAERRGEESPVEHCGARPGTSSSGAGLAASFMGRSGSWASSREQQQQAELEWQREGAQARTRDTQPGRSAQPTSPAKVVSDLVESSP